MEELRPDRPPDLTTVAKSVVSWHNRHPLARRISAEQVHSVGWVALPFAQRPGVAPLAEQLLQAEQSAQSTTAATEQLPVLAAQLPWPQRKWLALKTAWRANSERRARVQARRKSLLAAFSEDFMAPVSPRQAAQWALGHGLTKVGLGDWPVRAVLPDPAWGRQDTKLLSLYLATAAIEIDGRRVRVLLPAAGAQAAQAEQAVLGPRLLSLKRGFGAMAGLLAGALLGAVALTALHPAWPEVLSLSDKPGLAVAPAPQASPASPASPFGTGHTEAGAAAAETGVLPVAVLAVDAPEPAASSLVPAAVAQAAMATDSTPVAASASPPVAEQADSLTAAAAAAAAADASGAADVAAAAAAKLPPPQALPIQASPVAAPPKLEEVPELAALPPDDPPPRVVFFRPGQRLVPLLDEATKQQAKETVAALRKARGDVVAAAPSTTAAQPQTTQQTPQQTTQNQQPQIQPSFDPGQVDAIAAFALTSRLLRTRAESEQMQAAVRALLAQHTAEPLLVELWPSGDDWRVVCWPFTSKRDAQLARAVLLSRGLRMETVEF